MKGLFSLRKLVCFYMHRHTHLYMQTHTSPWISPFLCPFPPLSLWHLWPLWPEPPGQAVVLLRPAIWSETEEHPSPALPAWRCARTFVCTHSLPWTQSAGQTRKPMKKEGATLSHLKHPFLSTPKPPLLKAADSHRQGQLSPVPL